MVCHLCLFREHGEYGLLQLGETDSFHCSAAACAFVKAWRGKTHTTFERRTVAGTQMLRCATSDPAEAGVHVLEGEFELVLANAAPIKNGS